jgi:K+/H+ antiporter YhaU regulatory subunit KhtT
MVIYLAIIIAVILISFFLTSFVMRYVPAPWNAAVSAAFCLIILSPFLWAMGFKHTLVKTTRKLMNKNRFNRTVILSVFILRSVVVLFVSYTVIRHFFTAEFWAFMNIHAPHFKWINFGFALIYTVMLRALSPAMKFYKRIEERFMDNLNKRQQAQVFEIPEILQENCHLQKITLSPDSDYSGKLIKETDFRDNYNVSVVSVERGKHVFELPHSDFQLFPYDKITFVGHEDHLRLLVDKLEVSDDQLIREHVDGDVEMYKVEVDPDSQFIGVALKDSGLSDQFDAMVIAIERDGHFILNPSAKIKFQPSDIVWFVAQKSKAEVLIKS